MKILPRHHRAIGLLLQGKTQAQVATELGVNSLSVHRWLRNADFMREYRDAVRRTFGEGLDKLQAVLVQAVTTLQTALNADKDADAIRAATALLTNALRAKELADLEERIAALENREGQS